MEADWKTVRETVFPTNFFIRRNGLIWNHAPAAYGPPKPLYTRWKRWSRRGVFATVMTERAAQAQLTQMIMIDVESEVRHWSGNHWRGL